MRRCDDKKYRCRDERRIAAPPSPRFETLVDLSASKPGTGWISRTRPKLNQSLAGRKQPDPLDAKDHFAFERVIQREVAANGGRKGLRFLMTEMVVSIRQDARQACTGGPDGSTCKRRGETPRAGVGHRRCRAAARAGSASIGAPGAPLRRAGARRRAARGAGCEGRLHGQAVSAHGWRGEAIRSAYRANDQCRGGGGAGGARRARRRGGKERCGERWRASTSLIETQPAASLRRTSCWCRCAAGGPE